MTTNQTIDGVPGLRSLLERVTSQDLGMSAKKDRAEAAHELRALLDAPECRCKRYGKDNPHWPCQVHSEPYTQPQGEPVAEIVSKFGDPEAFGERELITLKDISRYPYGTKLYVEQPAPVAVVPDGYCIMPRQLTAENGAKSLLLGEFKLLVTMECPECCELEEPTEGCSICDGEGEYGQKHTIPWDQIKFIYSKAVSGLAKKAESAKSR